MKTEARLQDLYATFLRIGGFTIGGGYTMLPMFQKELVETRHWITEEEILDYYALAQSVPGIIAINTAILVGYKLRKIPGAIAATAGVVTPSLLILMLIAAFFPRFQDDPIVQSAFRGVRAGVVGLIIVAVIRMGKRAIRDMAGIVLAVLVCLAAIVTDVSPPYLILCGAAAGIALKFRRKRLL
ncbi:chromate transport protein ChrA [Candidatus Moduliflexus flocculans]|uniref:Chromate transport protein ChrA n=1 Tax=Candidatus Moduliflexus flocculans TaxID=1499966 RepID=A0A081BQT2_9BACT|nr:chromate transport protein ChrA [Candidatus Moduliflexus flocculans]